MQFLDSFILWMLEQNTLVTILMFASIPFSALIALGTWAVLVAKGSDHTQVTLSFFGVSLTLNASRQGVERRKPR